MSTRAAAFATLLNRPLAWERSHLDAMLAAVNGLSTDAPMQAVVSRRREASAPAVGVLPIVGPLTYRESLFSSYFGGTAITDARDTHAHLQRKSDVEAILMLVDSPGGDVTGIEEFAYVLREGRKVKPLLAVVDCMACSAAYWLAAQASEIIGTPSARTGSVGVYQLHVDESQLLENVGVKPTFIHAGRFKVEGNPYEPLTSEAHKQFQREVDEVYRVFLGDIVKGRGRGLTPDRVQREFGEGRVVGASEALRRGMIDRVFPTTAGAFKYAVSSYPAEAQRRADMDHADFAIAQYGSEADRKAAFARLRARQESPADAQLEADRDFVAAGIRIAERM